MTSRRPRAACSSRPRWPASARPPPGSPTRSTIPLAYVTNNLAVLRRDVGGLHDLLLLYQQGEAALFPDHGDLLGRIKELAEAVDLPYVLANLDGLLTRSREGLRRIHKIVSDLRDFAHLDDADAQEADLNAGIAATASLMRGVAQARRVALDTDLAAMPTLACHPAKINLVVQSLLSNAIDACAPGGRVVVSSRLSDGAIEIEVLDDGEGIAPELLDRVFDPFFTTKPIGKGTGLGLSMSFGVIRDHGGTIVAESSPGAGAPSPFACRLGPPSLRRWPPNASRPRSRDDGKVQGMPVRGVGGHPGFERVHDRLDERGAVGGEGGEGAEEVDLLDVPASEAPEEHVRHRLRHRGTPPRSGFHRPAPRPGRRTPDGALQP